MITNTKKIFIETERSETVVLRLIAKDAVTAFCETCGTEVHMLDLNSAVSYSGRTARTLIREIEANAIHSYQMASGHLLICTNSLPKLHRPDAAGETWGSKK